ncbi:MAG TPA: molecular chaperone TorD family protein [Methylomusa anaerophila]|uniref:Tat proofreading chaperone DmsD n=1 Tax=Methylomusa anaerophila TaxID=1930071 RepID=A0A348AET9_9FIRM|nr:molecular chaperone TorD family protein [Methylomusa anaerophila]BBB89587.1 Tat proofreading chaperone DmsD [Methylomusa anaerophila]HML89639.1 molecular chaperone TorD family protein [Methylomusa anaerophila]
MIQSQPQWEHIHPALDVRIFAYDFLRRIFLEEPSAIYLKTIVKAGLMEDFPFSRESEMIGRGVCQVADYLREYDVLNEKIYDRLRWDYTKLFIGPYQLPAPLWESAYLSEERLLFQESTFAVRCAYFQYGFLPRNYRQEADDHLGLELDFMYQLACLAREKSNAQSPEIREILRDSKLFLKNHLLNWVPALARDIRQHAGTGFYQGMAAILDGYLQIDLEALGELINVEVIQS